MTKSPPYFSEFAVSLKIKGPPVEINTVNPVFFQKTEERRKNTVEKI
jgi:hypothetical protein